MMRSHRTITTIIWSIPNGPNPTPKRKKKLEEEYDEKKKKNEMDQNEKNFGGKEDELSYSEGKGGKGFCLKGGE